MCKIATLTGEGGEKGGGLCVYMRVCGAQQAPTLVFFFLNFVISN